jgi:hypothetical protein
MGSDHVAGQSGILPEAPCPRREHASLVDHLNGFDLYARRNHGMVRAAFH